MIPGYDAWKQRVPDEPEPVEVCTCCGKELFAGDYIYTIDGEKLCEDCLNDEYRRML